MARRLFSVVALSLLASLLAVGCGAPTPTHEPPPVPPPPAPAPTQPPTPAPAPTQPPEPKPPSKTEAIEVQNCALIMYNLGKQPTKGATFAPSTVQAVLTGEVLNNTSDNVKLIELLVRLRDEDKGVPLLGPGAGPGIRLLVPVIRPGETSPFVVCGATAHNATDFEVEVVDYKRTTEELFPDIEVSECKGYRKEFDDPPETYRCGELWRLYDCYVVEGKVTNTGGREARNIKVVCAFYHDSGAVVHADEWSPYGTHLLAGAEDTFRIPALCSPDLISDFKIQVIAQ